MESSQVTTAKPRRLASLYRELKANGVRHREVAAEAHVKVSTVCHVLAGRVKSKNVVTTAKRLIAERQALAENGSAA